jgi:predicted HTH transcriptional regulator
MQNTINLDELSSRESETVEWKENVADVEDVIQTAVAFANDFLNLGGGYIICGAKQSVDVYNFPAVHYTGLTSGRFNELKDEVVNTLWNPNKVSPPIVPKVDEVSVPNDSSKKVLIFTIDASRNAHTFKSKKDGIPRYYVRTDSNTRGATNGIQRELLRRKEQLEPWDKRINQKATITDMDEILLRQYLQDMRLWSPNKTINEYLSEKDKIEEFIPPLLGKTGIGKPLHPKNFALMVFGKHPIDFCAGAYAIFTIFEGTDRSKPHGETQWITGSIVEQAKKLIELLNIESTIAIDKSSETANQIKYPKIALKEAVVNAIVHRDYEIDQPVRVEVYSDRTEIYSPGGLPNNIDKEKFKQGNAKASWRNQAFGRIFTRLNLAQHQGSGIGRIIESMKEEGCPSPIFEVEYESITCTLPAHPRHQIMKLLSDAESEVVIRDFKSAYKKIDEILKRDLYNYRALELFCEVNLLLNTPEKVLEFIKVKQINFQQIRSNTLILISETLSTINDNPEALVISKDLLEKAVQGRLEERQLIKVAYTFKKLGENKNLINFIDDVFIKYPNLVNNSSLLQQRGRAAIDLAKVCKSTLLDKSASFRIKNKAKEEFEKYRVQAERDLNIAFQFSESPIEKEWISKDLAYLKVHPDINLEKPRQNKSLRLTNLPDNVTQEQLQRLFEQYGNIDLVKLHTDKNGKFQRSALVKFKTPEMAYAAYKARFDKKLALGTNKIIVNWYTNKSK